MPQVLTVLVRSCSSHSLIKLVSLSCPIFWRSLDQHVVPTIWKTPHNTGAKESVSKVNNDFCPISLTSIITKILERAVVGRLNKQTGDLA